MPPVHYRIAPLDASAHLFDVRCTVANPDAGGQRFRLPTWAPGSYLIREFARHFVEVTAQCDGKPVNIVKDGKDSWRAAQCAGSLSVTAHVHAHDLSVRASYLDTTRAYFNGSSVFLSPVGREADACVVDIDPSFASQGQHTRVATAMRRDGAPPWGFGRHVAANYDELIDHPVEIGDFETAAFVAGNVAHDVAITGARNVDLDRLANDLARVCQWQCDLFGGQPGSAAPFDRYLFLVTAVGDGYGGLEHRASTSLLCKRDQLPRAGETSISDDYLTFLGLASHEYFHSWNVKRIKPAAFVPYDLSREGLTRQLWAFEGITSYYDDLALVRSGVIAADRYLELVGRALTGVLRTPGRRVQSVADASFDAWIKHYRQDENSANAGISYYTKGSLVALALDLTLRARGSSLDAMMRELWQRFGSTGTGVPEGEIARMASTLTGEDLSDFFARYVDGVDDPPLETLLRHSGVTLRLRASEGPRDRGGRPASSTKLPSTWLGARWAATGELKLAQVFRDGPASRAGMSANDVIVAVDGLKANDDTLNATLARAEPGARITIDAFRRDVLMHFDATLDAAPLDTAFLALDEKADDRVLQRRVAWLGA